MNELARLDLRGVICPLNFVRTKLALDKIDIGGTLEVVVDHGESAVSVSSSLTAEGHEVKEASDLSSTGVTLIIKKLTLL
jgi:tRNA 2-thiouridine synthesizing protein A